VEDGRLKITVPGDKSISQRALIFASLADGESRLAGVLPGEDPSSTAGALRALGAEIDPLPADGSPIRVRGRGLDGLRVPARTLDLGNSGTGARLLMGVLAACPFESTMTGDASLRSRPMARVTEPLSRMGARFESLEKEGRLPIRVHGGNLHTIEYDQPVATAQVKSAILLAALVSGHPVIVNEPGRTRDHTERMLRHVGAVVNEGWIRNGEADAGDPSAANGGGGTSAGAADGGDGAYWRVELAELPKRIEPLAYRIPGDFSSAAWILGMGALGLGGGPLTADYVGLNPTRTGFLDLLKRMGVHVAIDGGEDLGDEPTGALTAHASEMRGIDVSNSDLLTAMDEVPMLAALAARAKGVTRITGAHELRVKETDRIEAIVQGMRAIGVDAEELHDGFEIEGTTDALEGTVDSHLDHRIAMAFGILGALPGNRIQVTNPECVAVSFPTFWDVLRRVKG
jgi:3-phosphoshikimate 1-carboxyvinyltransferase